MNSADHNDARAGEQPPSDGTGPFPTPGPLPGPIPLLEPAPVPVPDWWRCLRVGPVSGRYEGSTPAPQSGRFDLHLRVDIDPRSANSPVMNRVSGDIYQVFRIMLPGRPAIVWQVYVESWIVDAPRVTWSRCFVDIAGTVRYWKGQHPATDVAIRIPWDTLTPAGPASVTFTEQGGAQRSFTCPRVSDCFRDLRMEIDVCASVNQQPLLPVYDTSWHNNRPANLPQRVLTVEAAYREAGVCVTIPAGPTVIDDSAPQFTSWSPAELHDAMETSFSAIGGGWPKWHMWGLMAGLFDSPGVGGIMFDAAAQFGGAGDAPERQGYAVFRNHSWFNNLVAGTPQNQDQAWAMRHFLYTWVHEAGHGFNFLHSWDKGRPDSLSWMNYDWRYDQRNGTDSFWGNFRFRLDNEELIHMRHGDRAAVIMGGDPWASGGHLATPDLAMAQLLGDPPLELLIRSKEYFQLMEPVLIELRLRNRMPDLPLTIDKRLGPEFGGVVVHIQKPDGTIVEYAPNMCALGTPEPLTLAPSTGGTEGEDRYSKEIFLAYGRGGFYFDRPGDYQVRAFYQGLGDVLILSNVHRIRIGTPMSAEMDRLGQDFFSDAVGLALYLQGSQSPYLSKGMGVIEEVADRCKDSVLGVKLALTLANSAAEPFFRITDPVERKLTKTSNADPKRALELTKPALDVVRKEKVKELNLIYGRVVRRRAEYHQAADQPKAAKEELATLRQDLAQRNANQSVLDRYKALEDPI